MASPKPPMSRPPTWAILPYMADWSNPHLTSPLIVFPFSLFFSIPTGGRPMVFHITSSARAGEDSASLDLPEPLQQVVGPPPAAAAGGRKIDYGQNRATFIPECSKSCGDSKSMINLDWASFVAGFDGRKRLARKRGVDRSMSLALKLPETAWIAGSEEEELSEKRSSVSHQRRPFPRERRLETCPTAPEEPTATALPSSGGWK
ncbi:hypothetical protein JCGZ_05800 [Jatropha curcas]|uniref:Uncharacterized protein n=1 Tax=Jatropha curcas TaxID=180498 RepID=A0A067KQ05_JATCU|nr:hypothetical protein JCGZ_05800 [Jatropha curcas]